jgi:hypothetical protein
LADPAGVLTNLIQQLSGNPADADKVNETINRFSFSRQSTGDSKDSYLRKGQKGDWRNHFDLESANLFEKHYGDALILAGYEPDSSWVKDVIRPSLVDSKSV